MANDPQKSYEISSPLLNCIPQTALDAVFGAAALVGTDQNLLVLSRNWNEFMARSGRGDLSKNSVLGSSLLQFFRDEQQKQVFRNLLDSMAKDELGTHNQVVDLGKKDSPFYVQFHVHPLWNEGVHIGYLLHCIDSTKEHANRLTLIDHDRQLLKLREMKDTYESELNAAKDLIGSIAKEQAEKEKELKQLQEKAGRKEKALKAAIKQAELSASKMTSTNSELDTLREEKQKLITELADTNKKLESNREELSHRDEEIAKLTGQLNSLEQERQLLTQKLESIDSKDPETESKLHEFDQTIATLETTLRAAEQAKNSLQKELESLREKYSELHEVNSRLEQALESAANQSVERTSNLEADLESLDAVRSLLSNALNALNRPLCWLSPSGEIQLSNPAFRDCFELDTENSKSVSYHELFTDKDAGQIEALLNDPFSRDNLSLRLVNGRHDLPFTLTSQFDDGRFIGCLGVGEHPSVSQSQATQITSEIQKNISGVRSLSGDLAESFGDLLTAVIGHASLAAAEADDKSPTLSDIRAIEESAGEAADLVRRLHALSGNSRHHSEADLKALVMNFTRKCYESESEASRIQLDLTAAALLIPIDNASVDVILRGIASHIDSNSDSESVPIWNLTADENDARLSVSCENTISIPDGWFDDHIPSKNEQGYDLYFAREVARAFGGRLEIHELNAAAELVLWLPLTVARTHA